VSVCARPWISAIERRRMMRRREGRTMGRWTCEVMGLGVMIDCMNWISGNGRAENHDFMMH
jgi:hypothetical protein